MTQDKRVATIIGAICAIGIAYAAWKFLILDVDEIEVEKAKSDIQPEPPAIRHAGLKPEIQSSAEGEGSYFHRRYHIRIGQSKLSPEKLISKLRDDINSCSPALMARFEKTKSATKFKSLDEAHFAVGDEFEIHITGPWNGSVRVAESDERSFTFVTKDGHFEAGGIRFSAQKALRPKVHPASVSPSSKNLTSRRAPGAKSFDIDFEIESWSRSRGHVVDIVYDKLSAARFAQTQMWARFCENVAELSGGKPKGNVKIRTERA